MTLHSTMFLLIPRAKRKNFETFSDFTFHNVSINTSAHVDIPVYNPALHSTMFLLIPYRIADFAWLYRSLHSTIFLLIPIAGGIIGAFIGTLHSTMFLLIP